MSARARLAAVLNEELAKHRAHVDAAELRVNRGRGNGACSWSAWTEGAGEIYGFGTMRDCARHGVTSFRDSTGALNFFSKRERGVR